MQELKPVAFLAHDSITGKDFYVSAEANYGVGRTPLYALPDTHRIVPVELLELAELLFRAEANRITRGDWELPLEKAVQIRAIIEDKP